MAHIARRVVQAQQARGESTVTLAERSGIEELRLSRIFRGEEDLRIHTVFVLAATLQMSPASLLQGIEWVVDDRGGGHFEVEE